MSAEIEDVPEGSYRCEGCGGIFKEAEPVGVGPDGVGFIPPTRTPICAECWRQMGFGGPEGVQ